MSFVENHCMAHSRQTKNFTLLHGWCKTTHTTHTPPSVPLWHHLNLIASGSLQCFCCSCCWCRLSLIMFFTALLLMELCVRLLGQNNQKWLRTSNKMQRNDCTDMVVMYQCQKHLSGTMTSTEVLQNNFGLTFIVTFYFVRSLYSGQCEWIQNCIQDDSKLKVFCKMYTQWSYCLSGFRYTKAKSHCMHTEVCGLKQCDSGQETF